MNFPRFWARGTSGDFSCWRWSATSQAEAQTKADQAARQLADRFTAGGPPPKHVGYYPDRPPREQILQELKDPSGQPAALITRNSYGCQVLNTARMMFVDIDLPEPKPAGGFFQRLFGRPAPVPAGDPAQAALTHIEHWTRSHPEWGWRIYRTRAGLRLLATQGLVEADSSTAREVFEALGADPLYRKLCQTQKCFRARLTPKPWRCGLRGKPARWPWLNERQEKKFQKWEAQYQSSTGNYATCELIRQTGNPAVHPEIQLLIQLHDTATRVGSKLPLA